MVSLHRPTIMVSLARFAVVILLVSIAESAHAEHVVNLTGSWQFAIDPTNRGEKLGWQTPPEEWNGQTYVKATGWDIVQVPHCWNVDPRYQYTGTAWYRKTPKLPKFSSGSVARLILEGVFYRCRVWVNGSLAGSHEGGYTPFEIDVSKLVRPGEYNFIVLEVDNSWDDSTMPGSIPGPLPRHQVYPWWNYGGIRRPVKLVVHEPVFPQRQRIVTKQTEEGRGVEIELTTWVRNATDQDTAVELNWTLVTPDGLQFDPRVTANSSGRTIPAGTCQPISLQTTLPLDQVKLWSLNAPQLYRSKVSITAEGLELEDRFGIRFLEISNGEFRLNGEPIRIAGANRVMDHPIHGSSDPPDVVQQDVALLQDAHLRFSRLQHYPVSESLLDWADERGLLIIAEAGNWQFPPSHLSSPEMRATFQHQMREMVESAENHPSIIAWSVGNEYPSWSQEGVAWTRDMYEFTKSLDTTRPVTFAAIGGSLDHLGTKSENPESFDYVDFISINLYHGSTLGKNLDLLHSRWPNKPIFISEFGARSDFVSDETQRIERFREYLAPLSERPYVCGLGYWTLNDYRSRFPGTNPNGYRPWGLVDADRVPRELYKAMVDDLAPATIEIDTDSKTQLRVTIMAKKGFPQQTLDGFQLQLTLADSDESLLTVRCPTLRPGESKTLELALPADTHGEAFAIKAKLFNDYGYTAAQAISKVSP